MILRIIGAVHGWNFYFLRTGGWWIVAHGGTEWNEREKLMRLLVYPPWS